MPDKKAVLQCRLADESAAAAYRESCLDDADRARLLRAPELAGRTDWRVSRFLKQQGGKICSLSHSKGRAAVLVCSGGTVCGVDIETVRPRNFQALAEWVCSPEERVFWHVPVGRQRLFTACGASRKHCLKPAVWVFRKIWRKSVIGPTVRQFTVYVRMAGPVGTPSAQSGAATRLSPACGAELPNWRGSIAERMPSGRFAISSG
ncbi:hypothetical protein NEILACOT_03063 [Neisseria lactamica ATCC 23970]|uniref:4'-phosphopantetheinyl transferase family protein n=1 Tax=Neisseria lactamica ATCC 23970 TaxID=546265 RepID=D0W6C6_NEILA|nr:hypothetical protein NEILACOT_03063 [Neisseria lactamica ATCC 23970]